MKIIISEKQFLLLSESELGEAVGVPPKIVNTSIKIYDKLIDKLDKDFSDLDELKNEKIVLTGNFQIGDVLVRKILIDFKIIETPSGTEREWVSATHYSVSKLLDSFVFKTANKKTEIKMGFSVALNEDDKVEDLVNYLKETKNQIIPTIAHEIKHAYFEKKSNYETLSKRAEYQATQAVNFPFIKPLNEFFFNSYFIHAIENVVRPTELYAHMEMQGITQKQFLNFFLNSDIYKNLKEIKEFTYQNLRDDLIAYTDVIKNLLDRIKVDTTGMTDDDLVDEILRLALVNLTNARGEIMNKILITNPLEILIGFTGDKEKFFRKYINYVTKFGEDYESFFKSEEKKFQRVSDEMIRKLSKLYSIARKDK